MIISLIIWMITEEEIMEENKEAYSSIDRETRDMLEVVANINIPEKFKIVEEGRERYDMCKAFEDMILEGYEAGMADGIVKLIKNLVKNANMTLEQAMEILEIPEKDRTMYAGRVEK